ncbi:MAG: hypothetical protein MUE42_00475 [Opitutaceae bacterium]|jgi:hypothetical protein|nr:hypothetical protein [Opitutaceae bacterium]
MNTQFIRIVLVSLGIASVADAQPAPLPEPAFLEVIPLTFLWHRTQDSYSTSKIGDPNVSDQPTGTEQPVERVTTNNTRTRRDTPPGVQGFFVEQLRQDLFGRDTGDYEILAVRNPARNMDEFVNTPYDIYLTRNNRTDNILYPSPSGNARVVSPYVKPVEPTPIPTGMTITFGPALGRHTENFDGAGNLLSVSGSVATTFKIEYASHFRQNINSPTPWHQYNLLATGTVNFSLRRVKVGTRSPAVIVPIASRMRGVGTFDHRYYASPTDFYYYIGLSSVDVIMGRAQLLPRERFELPPEPDPDAGGVVGASQSGS